MLLTTAVLALHLLSSPQDTVRADQLVREISDLLHLEVIEIPDNSFVAAGVKVQPPPVHLAAVAATAPFALTWLLEGDPAFDRATLLAEFKRDTAAMRRALTERLARSRAFSGAVVRLAKPIVAARGTVVVDAPEDSLVARAPLSSRTALALAARFIQAARTGSTVSVSMCAKPEKLRAVPVARDPAVEAWMYSIVRSTEATPDDLSHIALPIARQIAAANPLASDETLDALLWERLEADASFGRVVSVGLARTAQWSPVMVTP